MGDLMQRRRFVGMLAKALAGGVFVPRFERWFRPNRLVPEHEVWDVWQKIQWPDDRDAFVVQIDAYWNFGVMRRNAHGIITSIDAEQGVITIDSPLLGMAADDYVIDTPRRVRPPRRDFFRQLLREVA